MMVPSGGDHELQETPGAAPGRARWAALRDAAGLLTGWGAWGFMTVALLLFVQQNSRNVPYMDDFAMVSMMTGFEPVSLRWAWAQHNEHRPLLSRLMMAGLSRFVANDFRAPRYANVALLSAMAATMLILARRLRGSARMSDAVLPVAILNVAQAETLMIGFAMNLIVSSFLAIAFIVVAARTDRSHGTATAALFGLGLVLLPLCGGSGLAMLPPLILWLAGYAAWGWWSGKRPGLAMCAIVCGLLVASLTIAVLYFLGYNRPPHHPLPPSAWAVASSTIMYLSLAVYPQLSSYWWPAGLIVVVLLSATLALLAKAIARLPDERPCALGLVAIVLAMVTVAGTVGVSRGLRPGRDPRQSLCHPHLSPLLRLYIAWLKYGNVRARVAVHLALLALDLRYAPRCLPIEPEIWPIGARRRTAGGTRPPCARVRRGPVEEGLPQPFSRLARRARLFQNAQVSTGWRVRGVRDGPRHLDSDGTRGRTAGELPSLDYVEVESRGEAVLACAIERRVEARAVVIQGFQELSHPIAPPARSDQRNPAAAWLINVLFLAVTRSHALLESTISAREGSTRGYAA